MKVEIAIFVGVLLLWPAGFIIGKILDTWKDELNGSLNDSHRGLEKAGLWIGCIERLLIFIFVLTDQLAAVGFLIAAKSVFRFGELNQPGSRKVAEYYLIGTLISFTIAILLGMLTKYLFSV